MNWELTHCYDRSGSEKGKFDYARGISISNKTENITIADISNKRIQVLNSKYEYLCDWNTEVLSACKLCPLDVHRVNDQVLAAVIEGHVILYQCPDVEDLKSTDVQLLNTFGNNDFVFPRAIISMNGKFFVSDVGKHRVTMHDEDGRIIRSIGSLGVSDSTNFNWPYYMCTDDKGRLAVSDSHNRCVKLFDKNLNFVGKFGKEVLTCCVGVAYTEKYGGNFYVAEYDNKSMYEFSSDGKLTQCVDDHMPFPGQAIDILKGDKMFCTMHHGFFDADELLRTKQLDFHVGQININKLPAPCQRCKVDFYDVVQVVEAVSAGLN